jgi:hypothetical protein
MRFPVLSWPVRLAWLVTGLMWFVWLGVEDRSVIVVLLLGTAISFSAALTGLDRWGSGRRLSEAQWWTRWIAFGLSVAAGIGPLALLLMTVKVSLHSHGLPDFNLGHVEQLLRLWPVWGLGALLCGLGLGALGKARPE